MCSWKYEARQLKAHRKSYHKHQKLCIECTLCGKIYKDGSRNMHYRKFLIHELKHRKQVKAEASRTCKVCRTIFPTQSKLKKHIVIHDEKRQKPFQCKTCLDKFFSLVGLNSHIVKQHVQHIEALM